MIHQSELNEFLDFHKLSCDFQAFAEQWYFPLVDVIKVRHRAQPLPLLVGINGCQGSGKSTLAALLELILTKGQNLSCVVLSVDDFYLTRSEREQLGRSVHPLLKIRGVPGTHDSKLLYEKLSDLIQGSPAIVPRFCKTNDDRTPKENWLRVHHGVDIIIFEGWFIGAQPQAQSQLETPINQLEAEYDSDLTWRHYINDQLRNHYQSIFAMIDYSIMLKAPSFHVVEAWRFEQEKKLLQSFQGDSTHRIMDAKEITHFIAHFERLTEHCLNSLPDKMDRCFYLDDTRRITHCTDRGEIV